MWDHPEFYNRESWQERDAQSRAYGELLNALRDFPRAPFNRPNLPAFIPLFGRRVEMVFLGARTIGTEPMILYIGKNRKLYQSTQKNGLQRFSKLRLSMMLREELTQLAQFIWEVSR